MVIHLKNIKSDSIKQFLDFLKTNQVRYRFAESANLVVLSQTYPESFLEPYKHIIRQINESAYPLAARSGFANTVVHIGDVKVGGDECIMMAGPCSVESEEQIFSIAEFLSKQGVKVLRGGAYKPRTSPYSFRGLGKQGLQLMRQAADAYQMKVVTEIMDLSLLDEVMQYADMLQVGSRNMQNFYMLTELGKVNKPIMLKRGMQAKVKEWLLAAEYILSGGNEQVILCERGIRSFDNETRNVMDVGVIPLIKELSHLPIIADPSHGTGASSRVTPLALASAIAGANGLLIEVHPNPEKALSDKYQAINYDTFASLQNQLNALLQVMKGGEITPITVS